MKKFILSVLALFFGLSLVGISVMTQVKAEDVVVEKQATEAGDLVDMTATESGEKMSDLSGSGADDYYLPYPGILPDHPMYWLKMIRDRVMLWSTRDSMKKSERLLLYSDKRIGAAEALAKGNQLELAISTATKAEKYLTQVIEGLDGLNDEEKIIMEKKVSMAGKKHIEVLEAINENVEGDLGGVLMQVIESIRGNIRKFNKEEVLFAPIDLDLDEQATDSAIPAEINPSL